MKMAGTGQRAASLAVEEPCLPCIVAYRLNFRFCTANEQRLFQMVKFIGQPGRDARFCNSRVACEKTSEKLHQFIDTLATQMVLCLRFRSL